MRLSDRVSIITGGGAGIGRQYSLGIAREGGIVVIADINDEGAHATRDEIVSNGGQALAIHTDVASQDDTERMARAAFDAFGRIDILVNNAAYFATLPLREYDEIPLDEWRKVMDVNVTGVFLCCRAVLPFMKEQRYGKIINISSGAVLGGNPKRVHYVTSKAALIGMSRSLARAVGDYNIGVNCLMPGGTASETLMAVQGPNYLQNVSGKAFKRVQVPEDLVGPLIFLASSESDYMTGTAMLVDGGSHMY